MIKIPFLAGVAIVASTGLAQASAPSCLIAEGQIVLGVGSQGIPDFDNAVFSFNLDGREGRSTMMENSQGEFFTAYMTDFPYSPYVSEYGGGDFRTQLVGFGPGDLTLQFVIKANADETRVIAFKFDDPTRIESTTLYFFNAGQTGNTVIQCDGGPGSLLRKID